MMETLNLDVNGTCHWAVGPPSFPRAHIAGPSRFDLTVTVLLTAWVLLRATLQTAWTRRYRHYLEGGHYKDCCDIRLADNRCAIRICPLAVPMVGQIKGRRWVTPDGIAATTIQLVWIVSC